MVQFEYPAPKGDPEGDSWNDILQIERAYGAKGLVN